MAAPSSSSSSGGYKLLFWHRKGGLNAPDAEAKAEAEPVISEFGKSLSRGRIKAVVKVTLPAEVAARLATARKRISKAARRQNRKLVWHGASPSCIMSITKQGVRGEHDKRNEGHVYVGLVSAQRQPAGGHQWSHGCAGAAAATQAQRSKSTTPFSPASKYVADGQALHRVQLQGAP